MNLPLVGAALLAFLLGVGHSALGERFLLRRLLRRDLPKLFGTDAFTKRTLRFAWHLTTLAWWGMAGVLLAFADVGWAPRAALGVLLVAFAVSGVVAVAVSRGRHLSWVVLLAIAGLVWVGMR